VISFPFELSLLAAESPKVLRALARINYEVTARYFQRRAAESGTVGKTRVGAITFVHPFVSVLKLRLHLHVCVFVERDAEALGFSRAQALRKDELGELLERLTARGARWLRKHGFAWDERDSDSNETRVFTFDGVLAPVAAGRGPFEKMKGSDDHAQACNTEMNPRPPSCDGAWSIFGTVGRSVVGGPARSFGGRTKADGCVQVAAM